MLKTNQVKTYIHINIWRDQLLDNRTLSSKAKLVGYTLCQYFRPNYPTYPAIRTLKEDTGLSINPVQDGIKELIDNGFIIRKQTRKKNDRFISNEYNFIVHVSLADTSNDTSLDTSNDTSLDTSNDTSPGDTEVQVSKGNTGKVIKKPKEKKKTKVFIPPTLEEVKSYCQERNNNVNPAKFFDYYSTGNWKDGKGNQVNNWKQKLLTWESKDDSTTGSSQNLNTNQPLCKSLNEIASYTLIHKIIVSASNKAEIYFSNLEDYGKFREDEKLRDKIKDKVTKELKVTGFEQPKFIN